MRLPGFFSCILLLFLIFLSCRQDSRITIGFVDIVEDATLAQARQGYVDALSEKGWIGDQENVQIIFRNAQGDMPALLQSVDYFINKPVDIIAANATMSAISAVQRTREIPVCMMVGPEPGLALLNDESGNPPPNLFGVYENLDYLDTSIYIIKNWIPDAIKVGVIYNQAETQSILALEKIKAAGAVYGLEIIDLPVVNSAETQMVAHALINRKIDVFFAMPDNIIFSSFEVIYKICSENNIPIFTSEAGLVIRGAVAAFGADFYQWGYQAGLQTAMYLESGMTTLPELEIVKVRQKVYHPDEAARIGFVPGDEFRSIKD